MLAVIGSATVSADSYSGTDQSNMNSNGAVTWYSYVAGYPTLTQSTQTLTWEDGFYNLQNAYWWPSLYYKQGTNSGNNGQNDPDHLGLYGYWWPNTAQLHPETTLGDHYISVTHYWGISQGGHENTANPNPYNGQHYYYD